MESSWRSSESRNHKNFWMSRYIEYSTSRALACYSAPIDTKPIHQCEDSTRKSLNDTTALREKAENKLSNHVGFQVGEGDGPLDPGGWVTLGPIVHDFLVDRRQQDIAVRAEAPAHVAASTVVRSPKIRGRGRGPYVHPLSTDQPPPLPTQVQVGW